MSLSLTSWHSVHDCCAVQDTYLDLGAKGVLNINCDMWNYDKGRQWTWPCHLLYSHGYSFIYIKHAWKLFPISNPDNYHRESLQRLPQRKYMYLALYSSPTSAMPFSPSGLARPRGQQISVTGTMWKIGLGRYSHYRYTIDTEINRYVSIRS